MKIALTFLLTLLSFIVNAQVDCDLRLRVRNIDFSWDGTSQVATGQVRLRRGVRSTQCSSFRVGFSQGSAASYNRRMFRNGNYLDYNIYANSTTNVELKTLGDFASSDDNVLVTYQNNNQRNRTVNFEARLPIPNDGRSFLATGVNYRDTITATVTGVSATTVTESNNFRVRVTVPTEIDISLVSPGSNFDVNATSYVMNFGNFTAGESQSVDLKVRSNAGYTVDITSTNGGQLRHITQTDVIGYQMQVNGGNQSFPGAGSPLNLGSASGVTPNDGVTFNLNFQVGSLANKVAGQYQDTITITAASID